MCVRISVCVCVFVFVCSLTITYPFEFVEPSTTCFCTTPTKYLYVYYIICIDAEYLCRALALYPYAHIIDTVMGWYRTIGNQCNIRIIIIIIHQPSGDLFRTIFTSFHVRCKKKSTIGIFSHNNYHIMYGYMNYIHYTCNLHTAFIKSYKYPDKYYINKQQALIIVHKYTEWFTEYAHSKFFFSNATILNLIFQNL